MYKQISAKCHIGCLLFGSAERKRNVSCLRLWFFFPLFICWHIYLRKTSRVECVVHMSNVNANIYKLSCCGAKTTRAELERGEITKAERRAFLREASLNWYLRQLLHANIVNPQRNARNVRESKKYYYYIIMSVGRRCTVWIRRTRVIFNMRIEFFRKHLLGSIIWRRTN